jgi:DNA gyrase subunit A
LVRRTEYDLARAKDRAHILEGLKIALDHIDAVIKTIRESATKEEAHVNLMKKFKLSDKQATAILEMRLQTLAGLERKKIEDELDEKYKLIAYLEDLLKHREKLLALLKTELLELKDKYGDDRRTKVIRAALGDFSDEDLIPDEEAILTLTVDGYVKRMRPDTYRTQRRGGKGVQGATAKEGDELAKVMSFTTHDNLFFFTNTGKVFQVKGYEIPESSRTAKGQAIVNFIQISPEEKITAVIPFNPEGETQYLFMATAQGTVKKCKAADFGNVRRSGLIAINLDKGDTLGWVGVTSGKDEIIMTTKSGQAIRYNESDVRAMGRAAAGVRGMKFDQGDAIVGMDVIQKDSDKKLTLTVLSEHGYGKKSPLTQYKVQKRGGSGIKTMQLTDKTGPLVTAIVTSEDDMESDMLITSHKGIIIRVPFNSVPQLSRATQGVRIMRPQAGDRVGAFTLL